MGLGKPPGEDAGSGTVIMNLRNGSDFIESFAVHASLKLALKRRIFISNPRAKRTAERLVASLEGRRSTYGRQLKMLQLMQKGASVQAMGKGLRCSRRTVFRYLNHLENAGVEITLSGEIYRVDPRLLATLGA